MTVSVRVWRHRDLKKLSHWTHFIYVYALSMCVAVPSFLEAMPLPPPPPKYQRYNKLLLYQFSGKMSSVCITRSLIYSSVRTSQFLGKHLLYLPWHSRLHSHSNHSCIHSSNPERCSYKARLNGTGLHRCYIHRCLRKRQNMVQCKCDPNAQR